MCSVSWALGQFFNVVNDACFLNSFLVVHATDDVHLVVNDGAGGVKQPEGHRGQPLPGLLARLGGQAGVGDLFGLGLTPAHDQHVMTCIVL